MNILRGFFLAMAVMGCPVREFSLRKHAHLISSLPEGFRRGPGMQTHMIEAVAARNAELTPIILNVPGGIACQREDAAVDIAAQKDGFAVEKNIFALGGNLAQADTGAECVDRLITASQDKG